MIVTDQQQAKIRSSSSAAPDPVARYECVLPVISAHEVVTQVSFSSEGGLLEQG